MVQSLIAYDQKYFLTKFYCCLGDGRMDSPGHCAQYCTYTLIEYESKDIVACEIINKRETDLKSTSMEKKGLKRALQSLKDSGIIVKEICTDASTTVAAFIGMHFLMNILNLKFLR